MKLIYAIIVNYGRSNTKASKVKILDFLITINFLCRL